jgi:hypothetical protein
VYRTLREIFTVAWEHHISTAEATDRFAESRIDQIDQIDRIDRIGRLTTHARHRVRLARLFTSCR